MEDLIKAELLKFFPNDQINCLSAARAIAHLIRERVVIENGTYTVFNENGSIYSQTDWLDYNSDGTSYTRSRIP